MKKTLLLMLLPCIVFAEPSKHSDNIYKKFEKATNANINMQYLEMMHHLRALQRKYYLQHQKEKMQDMVNSKRKQILLDMMNMHPGIEMNTQGVVGNIMIVNGYAIPSGTLTPYGIVRVVGPVGYVGNIMVAPDMGSPNYNNINNYMNTISSIKNSYYSNVPLPVSSGSLPSLPSLLSSAPMPPPPPPPSTPPASLPPK